MFTGIIDHTGLLLSVSQAEKSLRFIIETQFRNLQLGESIAVNGVCLTVTNTSETTFSCDISPETQSITTLKQCHSNDAVNLERALSVGDRLGGHYVTGHVDQTAVIKKITPHDGCIELLLTGFDKTALPFLISKGSLTINGVSLTINAVNTTLFPEPRFMLIPHTLHITNLQQLKENDTVNIEFDYYAKTIAHHVAIYLKQDALHDS